LPTSNNGNGRIGDCLHEDSMNPPYVNPAEKAKSYAKRLWLYAFNGSGVA